MSGTISSEMQASKDLRLGRLIDHFLGELPADKAEGLRLQFEQAVSKGADLSGVVPRFMHVLLTDPEHGAARFATDCHDAGRTVRAVAGLYRRVVAGELVRASEWWAAAALAAKAASAAEAALARTEEAAARAAAWAAEAAESDAALESATWAAWWAAEAAWAAAEAAYATAAAATWSVKATWAETRAARRDHLCWQAEMLLRLLSEVPGGAEAGPDRRAPVGNDG